MSGTAAVPNSFQAAVTATGLQLDNNFSTVVAYLNDPTNRNNYATGGAATNTIAITFAPPVVGGYTSGLELTWKWGATNSGATVLNANGIGDASLVNPDGSALQSGQGLVGSVGKGVYDGTRFIFITPPSPATKAAMQTATASATFVTPAQAIHHPGVAKAWVYFSGTATGTITPLAAYNVTNVVRTAAGVYTVNLTTAMTSTAYPCIATIEDDTNAVSTRIGNSKTATSFVVISFNAAFGGTDAAFINAAAYGTQ